MSMLKWAESVKRDAQNRTDSELMQGIDMLDKKVAKNKAEAKAISLMKGIYEYELQERLWECI